MRSLAGVCEEAHQCAGRLERNRKRMGYADFRARGLCVGSGEVEAGCTTAIEARLRRAGTQRTGRGKCNCQPALLQAERPLRAVLGGAGRAYSMMTGRQRVAASGEVAALEAHWDALRGRSAATCGRGRWAARSCAAAISSVATSGKANRGTGHTDI